jgi:uncharacterized protein (DUF697 family)
MGSKIDMPKELLTKCHAIIHSATVLSGAAGALPIPFSDAIPIGAAQITMIVSLGKVFKIPVSKSVAENIIGVGLATQGGRFVFANISKLLPYYGSVVGAATAVTITEALGWMVADDFYRISIDLKPNRIGRAINDIKGFAEKTKLRFL